MAVVGAFPFGRPIETLVQTDRRPKRVFVLGVYASAVHARWLGTDGRTIVNALAVASEPEIFWRGEGVGEMVDAIPIPPGAGRLAPAGLNLNGPSGRALDEMFLTPLSLSRANAWLCDLVPYSCRNERQTAALARSYDLRVAELDLPAYDWSPVPKVLATDTRRAEIADEVACASPEIIITLGDQPLRWFTRLFGSQGRLGQYGDSPDQYGRLHDIRIAGNSMRLLPLVHPRQAGRLGSHSAKWAELHDRWMAEVAASLIS